MNINAASTLNWRASLLAKIDGNNVEIGGEIQSLTLPNLSFSSVQQGVGGRFAKLPSDTATYSDIDMNLLLKDDFKTFTNLLKWGLGNVDNPLLDATFGSLTVELLDAYQKPIIEIEYIGIFPINISPLALDTSSDNNTLQVNATFDFNDLKVKYF